MRQSSAHPAPVSEDNRRGGGDASVGAQQHDAQVAQDAAHDDDVVHVGAGHFNEPANAQPPVFRKSGEEMISMNVLLISFHSLSF